MCVKWDSLNISNFLQAFHKYWDSNSNVFLPNRNGLFFTIVYPITKTRDVQQYSSKV